MTFYQQPFVVLAMFACGFVTAIVIDFSSPSMAIAQESKADTQETGAADTEPQETQSNGAQETDDAGFDSMLAEWNELDGRVDELASRFEASTDADEQSEIKLEYQALVDEQQELLEELTPAAIAAFQDDSDNETATQTLMGIATYQADNRNDAETLRIGQVLIDGDIDPRYFEVASDSPRIDVTAQEIFEELQIRQREASEELPRVRVTTNKGDIVIELFENEAPETVGNFISLVEQNFYDGVKFHRVIEDFMAQTGDPEGTGEGGPGYRIFCECDSPDARRHFTGSVSMAKEPDPDTGGSQFFMTFRRTAHLDGEHTVFGRVVSGLDVLNSITRTQPGDDSGAVPDIMKTVEVIRKRDHEYVPNRVPDSEDEAPKPEAESELDESEAGGAGESSSGEETSDPAPSDDGDDANDGDDNGEAESDEG